MKTTSQATVFIAILLLGLGCESPNTVVDNRFPDPAVIVGKIMSWHFADSMTIHATATLRPSLTQEVIASGRVSADWSFSLSLPDPPLAAQLSWGFRYKTVSDTSARFLFLFALGLSGPSRAQAYSVRNANMETLAFTTPGYFTSYLIFADRGVSVSGADTIISLQGIGAPDDTVVFMTEVQCARGWNRVVARQNQVREHLLVSTWRSEDVRTPNWYLDPWLQAVGAFVNDSQNQIERKERSSSTKVGSPRRRRD